MLLDILIKMKSLDTATITELFLLYICLIFTINNNVLITTLNDNSMEMIICTCTCLK